VTQKIQDGFLERKKKSIPQIRAGKGVKMSLLRAWWGGTKNLTLPIKKQRRELTDTDWPRERGDGKPPRIKNGKGC